MIQGINSYAPPTVLPSSPRAPSTQESHTEASQGLGATRTPYARPPETVGRAGDTVPLEAPPGTDPMLWSVLTTEERGFFARARAMGQITYGPGSRSAGADVPRGGRVDVRV
jgi:hypothetical protein